MFAVILFAAAGLSFLLQPLVARQLLPLAGGAPAVWTTSLVVFQALLLAGYWYAHQLQRLRFSWQLAIHAALVLAAALFTLQPAALRPPAAIGAWIDASPVGGVLTGLIAAAGLPYFLLSTTAPLLQAWFARGRRNPYWLYAASNAGSLLGLVAYPFAVEPFTTLARQCELWAWGFFAVAAGILVCGVRAVTASNTMPVETHDELATSPRTRHILKWMALSALTASLLASVTAHLSTDIAPMPLLWVMPLALYLATYIITFARWPDRARLVMARVAPMAICFSVVALLARATEPIALVAAVHVVGLVAVSLLCHGELAAARPPAAHLTAFYLALAAGGVLGGLSNAVIAPILFADLGPLEYPLALVLAALVRPNLRLLPLRWSDVLWPLGLLHFSTLLLVAAPWVLAEPPTDDEAAKLIDRLFRGLLLFGIPTAIAFALVWRPVRFALCLLAILSVGFVARQHGGGTLLVSRNFFGTLRVSQNAEFTTLTHGTTNHGMQRRNVSPPEPAMYYHRRGPVDKALAARPARRVAVIGLGCGAMAAYAAPGDEWTFFEIDPAVVAIAQDSRFFTFLNECKASTLTITLGDARRKLAEVPDGAFDLLAVDAFSSDAVPTHLLTREALELYWRKIAPGGRLLMHLSNRYLDLPNLAARGLRDLDPAMAVRLDEDLVVTAEDRAVGRLPSTWLIAARSVADLGTLKSYYPLPPRPGPLWTDDFTPLQGVWKRDDE
jgi:SAM-dependent methyltransferase